MSFSFLIRFINLGIKPHSKIIKWFVCSKLLKHLSKLFVFKEIVMEFINILLSHLLIKQNCIDLAYKLVNPCNHVVGLQQWIFHQNNIQVQQLLALS